MRNLTAFLRLYFQFGFRHLLLHKGRAIAVIVGIGLGAAVFTSVRLSIHASNESFTQSIDYITGAADYTIVRQGGRIPEKLIAEIVRHKAVQNASPVLSTYVSLSDMDAEPFLMIGFDPILDRSIRSWQMSKNQSAAPWGELVKTPFSLMLSEKLTRKYGLTPGSRIDIDHAQGKSEFLLIGELSPKGLGLVEGGAVGITDIATFQEFTGLYDVVDRIDIILRPGAELGKLSDIQKKLPPGVYIQPASENKETGRQMIRSYQINLSILSLGSLLVGMFLVYSLIALNAVSRRKELAILRSLGASSQTVFALFIMEGVVFGLAGWIVGIPISTVLVKHLLHIINRTVSTLFVRVYVDQITLNAWEVLFSFGLTLFISVLAAWQPAKEAMAVAPKEALATTYNPPLQSPRHRIVFLGILFIGLSWPISGLPGIYGVSIPGYLSTVLLFIGFSLLSPEALRQFGKRVAPVIKKTGNEPAHLACKYLTTSGMRTAVSVGALTTAVALFTAIAIMIFSFRQTVDLWVNQTITGDIFIIPKMASLNQHRDPLPQELIDHLQNRKDPIDLVPFRRISLTINGLPYLFEPMDLHGFKKHGNFIDAKGSRNFLDHPGFLNGEGVLVSEVFTAQTGLDIGDRFKTVVDGVPIDLPILGIIRDYRTHGGVVFFSLPQFNTFVRQLHKQPEPWGGVRIYCTEKENQEAVMAALRDDVIRLFGDRIAIAEGAELRKIIFQVFDETFAVTTVLLLISLIVAALGIATTLMVLVLERSRQLNTLIAVGAGFNQIRTMIFWEALFMVVTGEIMGLVCGFILSYYLVFVINYQSFGWTFLYEVDIKSLLYSLPLILIAALASALPAMKAAFIKPPAALLRNIS